MNKDPFESLHKTLEEHHEFPCKYVFKFIVPKAQADCMESFLKDCDISRRESKTGKYVSFTARAAMNCAEDVITVYRKSSEIPGCICM
jgi:putative lipoic acid-binding regulatory protein